MRVQQRVKCLTYRDLRSAAQCDGLWYDIDRLRKEGLLSRPLSGPYLGLGARKVPRPSTYHGSNPLQEKIFGVIKL